MAQMAGNTLGKMRWTFPVSVIVWRITAEPFPSVVSHLASVPTGYTIALEMSLNGSRTISLNGLRIGMIRPTTRAALGRIRRDPKRENFGCYEVARGMVCDFRCSVYTVLGLHRTIEDSMSVSVVPGMRSSG